MIYKLRPALLLIAFAAAFLSGCSGSKEEEIPVPFGGRWLLIEMQGQTSVPEGTFLYINTENLSYQISAGCNSFNGGYELEGEKIIFAAPAGTKKFCAELAEFETGYVRLITGAEQMLIRKNVLQIYKNGQLLLAFRKNDQ